MGSKRLRVGVIGCGNFGSELARIACETAGVELAAVAGGSDDTAARLAAELACACEPDAEALIRRTDVDAVIVASPNYLHKQHVLLAAQRGKHVFCEKPTALSYADCCQMVEACREASVVLMAGHILHFMDGIDKAKRLVREGALGRLLTAGVERTGWMSQASGAGWKYRPELTGGYVFHFIHELDLVQSFCGPALGVSAVRAARDGREALQLQLAFAGGGVGAMEYGSMFRWGEHRMTLNGTAGALQIDFSRSLVTLRRPSGTEKFGINGSENEDAARVRSYAAAGGEIAFTGAAERPPLFLRGPLRRELDAFRAAALGLPAAPSWLPLLDGTAALSSVATAEAAVKALETGKREIIQTFR
ncbi:Gfo/Idh/MocA family oxidoreductase [Paenibacillus athensensis]|uniref:Gfo/Idh/MocA family protein n=1 Tax=Paenibacillus athensensis TaxID=1967502 RepID=UPI00142F7803|nr:Gfo/Idh/MocA family oxidoreductase [Paenibacillus athensensis]MCD1261764.1 Gfo/Idh/MocA family oxidoreductase [Paenibacillus athensensis]